MRRILHPLWVVLAVVFLIEAWLWDHLEPVVARVVAFIPLRKLKAWLADRVRGLSPAVTLIVFIVPGILLFPLKLLGVWLLAHNYWFSAVAVIIFAKFVGVGVAAFIFDVTRPKLMQMAWFRKLYDIVMELRGWATQLVAPIMAQLKATLASFRSGSSSRWGKFVQRIQRMRSRAQSAR
jgi:hypothetical protein